MPNLPFLRQLLEKLLGEKSLADRSLLKEPTPSHDQGDNANMVIAKESVAFLADRDRVKFLQARVALDRMNDGTFGICLACADEISEKRIEAVPWSPFCISCQEKLDRNDLPEFQHLAAAPLPARRLNFG